MNSKIIAGIIIGIIVVIGLGYGFSNSENNSSVQEEAIIDENIVVEPIENNEGTQFTIELSDSVQATGP